jgi:hypothetical protein
MASEHWKRIGIHCLRVALIAMACFGIQGCLFQTVSDNFTTPAPLNANGATGTVGIWQVANAHLAGGGQAPTVGTIDIGITTPGRLTIIPANVPPPNSYTNGWYSDNQGPYVYQTVVGNFIAITNVDVRSANNPNLAPRGSFNAAGFLIKSPQSPTAPISSTMASAPAQQNWVMYNIGYQLNSDAREAKFTRPPVAPEDPNSSRSAIYLDPLPTTLDGSGNVLSLSAKLLVCRVGSELRLFRASSGQWVEERSLLAPGGASQPPNLYLLPPVMSVLPTSYFLSPEGYIRFPLPTTDQHNALQVGVMANSWAASPDNSVGPETRAEFHYIRFSPTPPSSTDDCASLMPVPND